MSAWGSTRVINTPRGDYIPQSDDLTRELNAAANSCGYTSFLVYIDGNLVEDASELQTNSIAALTSQARIEGVEPEIRIGVYNKPA